MTRTCRSRDGTEVHGQTFVNVFAPTDAHGQCLPADSKSLPIISRVSHVRLDFNGHRGHHFGFQLVRSASCWVAMFVFDLAVPASIVGGNPEELVHVFRWNGSVPWMGCKPWLDGSLLSSPTRTQRQRCCLEDLCHEVTSQPFTETGWTSSGDSPKTLPSCLLQVRATAQCSQQTHR